MVAEHDVIDLDRSHEHTVRGSIAHGHVVTRRAMVLRLVAVFVVGVVLGGVGVSKFQDEWEQQEQHAAVVLVAMPDSANLGGSFTGSSVKLPEKLEVINAGPAPITVHTAQAEMPGVFLRSTGQPRLIRPGETATVIVDMQFECSAVYPSEPLSIRFSVETADKQVRDAHYAVFLRGSGWERDVLSVCEASAAAEKR